jgi:pimeloyl-ACP methyl ester carboxylesterase
LRAGEVMTSDDEEHDTGPESPVDAERVAGRPMISAIPNGMPTWPRHPKALVLSGWLTRTSSKAAIERGLGFEVDCPRLPSWRLKAAIRQARDAHDRLRSDVIIGMSRGGAIALAIPDDRPLVLLAPAWRYFGVRPRPDAEGVVIHSPRDRIVPLGHSRELCRRCPGLRLVITGAEHRLNCPAGRRALAMALDDLVGLPPMRSSTGSSPERKG